MRTGACWRTRLRLRGLLAWSLARTVAGMPAGGTNPIVGFAPVGPFLLGKGPIAVECGTKLDRRRTCTRRPGM
jgi:hypothetical protein